MSMNELRNLYDAHVGKVSDKWRIYFSVYDEVFSKYRDAKINLLEIGIQNGGSLEIWAQYFVNAERFVGNDIAEKCKDLVFTDDRIHVIVGDATLEDTKQEISRIANQYDIVIDDGSHTSVDIVKAFCLYFPLLKEGGVFVVEDLHCSYWAEYGGGLFDPYSSISFFKLLVDAVNHEHWGTDRSRTELFAGFERHYGLSVDEVLLAGIHSVEFVNSVCVIRKRASAENELGERVVVGQDDTVFTGLKSISGDRIQVKSQESNFWATRSIPPAEEFLSLLDQNSRLSAALLDSSSLVDERAKELESLSEKCRSATAIAEERAEELQQLSQKYIAASAVNESRAQELETLSRQYISASAVADARAKELEILSSQLGEQTAQIAQLNAEIARFKNSIIYKIKNIVG